MRSLRDLVLVAFGAMGCLALARQALEPDALEAVAIPNAQEDVDLDEQPFGANFVVVPNSVVTINNGTQTRRVLIQFSAESALEDPDGVDQMELGYSFNGQGCFEQRGPLRFASRWEFATHTAIHVPILGPGTWTIQPCIRINNGDGDGHNSGVLGARTLTAEVLTK